MVLARRDTHEVLKLVDWHLLVFCLALFFVVESLKGTGLPYQTYDKVRGVLGTTTGSQARNLACFSALGSNVFSNVPVVLVAGKWIVNFAQPELGSKVMALATTLARILTVLGPVENITVIESARDHAGVGFWDYAKFGIPVTVQTTSAKMGISLLLNRRMRRRFLPWKNSRSSNTLRITEAPCGGRHHQSANTRAIVRAGQRRCPSQSADGP